MKTKINFRQFYIPIYFLSLSLNLFSQAVVFEKTFHFSEEDRISDMVKLGDNNFILIGTTINNSGFDDILVIKVNSSGDTLFTRIFDFDTVATANKIISLSDENLIIAGAVGTQALLMKLNQNGDSLWSKTYSNEEKCSFQNVVEVSNTDLIVAEWIEIIPTTSKLLRISNSGELISAIIEADPGSSYVGLIRTSTDEIYLSGYGGESYAPNFFLMKYDSNYNLVFNNSYNDILGINSCLNGDNQNYYLGGNLAIENTIYPSVIKTDENGLVDWIHTFDNEPIWVGLMDMSLDENQRLFILMEHVIYDQFYIAVLNQTNEQIGYGTFEINHPSMMSIIADNEYLYVSGSLEDETGERDACLIKLYADSLLTSIRPVFAQNTTQINLNPNPATDVLEIVIDKSISSKIYDISIYDAFGIKEKNIDSFNALITRNIDISTLPEGIHFMVFKSKESKSIVKKFTISR